MTRRASNRQPISSQGKELTEPDIPGGADLANHVRYTGPAPRWPGLERRGERLHLHLEV
jgi:hypothetical protein